MAQNMENDPILKRIGNFGKWQARTVGAFSLIGFFFGWQMLAVSIMVPEVDYWCSPAELQLDLGEKVNWTSPELVTDKETGKLDHCKVFDVDYSEIVDNPIILGKVKSSQNATRACKRWDYERSTWPETVVSQFDLVCDKEYWRSLSQSIYMFGVMVGSIGSGLLSDKFGRKRVTLIAAVGTMIFGVSVAFSTSMVIFTLLRWCVAVCSVSMFTCGYVYCMEIVGGNWGTYIGIGLEIPWSFAYMLIPLVSWIFPAWNQFTIAVSIPVILMIILLSIPGMVPESPRWLLIQGRIDDADKILNRASEMNGINIEKTNISTEENKEAQGSESSSNVLDLFKKPGLRRSTLIMYYLFFTNSFVYYGLTLNSGSLIPGDLHINIIVSAIFEILANVLTIFSFIYAGRRLSVCISMFLGGFCLIIIPAVSATIGKTILAQIGRFAITGSFSMVFVYAVEIFPTVVRNVGLGSSSTFARIGSIIAPYIGRELGKQSTAAPVLIFGASSLLASLLVLFLPETRNIALPDTIEEGELFNAENGGFMLCKKKKADVDASANFNLKNTT
eukprot:GFUD01004097.1.p1 GENE.GFUD01004097.1~~GFUD01004097.1.p1  ORF type:complete len:559 (-),score=90.28 GFUD01004097.1:300-1976(-)